MKDNIPSSVRYRAIGPQAFDLLPEANMISEDRRRALRVVSSVLPFRVNQHVVENLIDWSDCESDPVFRLLFPAREMLSRKDFDLLGQLHDAGRPRSEIDILAQKIRAKMNPHPSGQMEHNVPFLDGKRISGIQHKYRETVLYFPARGQTCHAYCNFCFRWAQFVGDKSLKFAAKERDMMVRYLAAHSDVTDLLVTGGDPMIMGSRHIKSIFDAMRSPGLEHVQTIRIGTKSITFWPERFIHDKDAEELLRSIEATVEAGKQVAVMAHLNHWREIDNPIARQAIRRLRDAGASIYSQAPLLAGINDNPDVWARNWSEQIKIGIQPYYMFVERDTGARRYFEVPLAEGLRTFREAIRQVSGLARTVHGPVMSAEPGKVEIIDAIAEGGGYRFLCQFLQSRIPDRVRRPFFALGPKNAVWFDDLEIVERPDVRGILTGLEASGAHG